MRQGLQSINRLSVRRAIIDDTVGVVAEFGKKGFEVLVLWLGSLDGTTGRIDSAFVPPQRSIRGEEGVGYFLSNDALFELNKALEVSGLRLIAQVHSHPGEAYHSDADDRFAIVTAEGGFSFVVPDFDDPPRNPCRWAGYSLRNGVWEELSGAELRGLFAIEDGE